VYYPKSAAGVLRLLWTLPYDIVHLHIGGTLPVRVQALCLACAAVPGKRSVLTFHSGGYATSPEGQTAGRWTMRGWMFRRFDRIIAVNDEIVCLFQRFGVPQPKVQLIPPHAVPSKLPDLPWPRGLDCFFNTHSPVLETVGLLEPEYDIQLQIRTLGKVRERHPGAGLVIVGSGSLEAELRQLIAAQPWRDHILLCGDVPHPITLQSIAKCDVLLRTTLYDGDAISIREGLHMGTPVIATDNGMRPEGTHLVPVGDETAVVSAIEQELARGRHQPVGESQEKNLEAVLELYRELTGS
jgi:glycosyltransferase involved in cell wall biosynthesis